MIGLVIAVLGLVAIVALACGLARILCPPNDPMRPF
jgi:hypothetical protein